MSSARSPLSDLQRKPASAVATGSVTTANATVVKAGPVTKVVDNVTIMPIEETNVNMLIIETPEREAAHPVKTPCGKKVVKTPCGKTVVVEEEVVVEEKKPYLGGAGAVIALVIWALVIFAAAYLLFYYFRPWFVLTDPNNPNSSIDTGKILLASFIVALIALIIIWLIKVAVGRK